MKLFINSLFIFIMSLGLILIGEAQAEVLAGEVLKSEKRLVLLTSLDAKKNIPMGRSKSWDINKKLEKIFIKKLKNQPEQLVIIHYTDQETLKRELSNPLNKAVFWVSHSNGAENGGLLNKNIILNYQGIDVTDYFQNPHQGIEYLGFVGCRARFLVEKFKSRGFMSNNENLSLFAREKKIDARAGLKKAIKDYKQKLKAQKVLASSRVCKSSKKVKMTIRRVAPFFQEDEEALALKIIQNKEYIGFFPKAYPGEIQETTVWVTPNQRKSKLKLVFDTGISSAKAIVGMMEIFGFNYQIFANKDGVPFGKGRHVYRYKDNLELDGMTKEVRNINCHKGL